MLCYTFSFTQSIDLEEVIPGPPFADARNGFLAMADVDNDGDPDIILSGKDSPLLLKTTLYRNDGTGNFSEITGTSFIGVQFGDASFADVDGDGDQDVLIIGSNLQPIQVANLYLNDGTGSFTLDPNTPFQPMSEGDLAFEDVDNDGDLDLLMSGYKDSGNASEFTALYLNNGQGQFTEAQGTSFEQLKFGSVAFIDMENDGDKDLIIAGSDGQDVLVTLMYANNGMGIFSLVPNTQFAGISSGDIAVGDSDGDGNEDVMICGLGAAGNLSILYTNDGTGVFSMVLGTPFPTTFLGTADFADFDRDGDNDILVTGSIQGASFTSNIYENQGSNLFVAVDSLEDVYLSKTSIADIDGDNDLDVVIVGIGSPSIGSAFKTRTYINQTLVGLSVEERDLQVSIFPNPSNGTFRVQGEQLSNVSLEVFNLKGELIYANAYQEANRDIQLIQSAGMYLVVIKSDQKIATRKLVLKAN